MEQSSKIDPLFKINWFSAIVYQINSMGEINDGINGYMGKNKPQFLKK